MKTHPKEKCIRPPRGRLMQRQRGVAAVELGLIMIPLLLLVFGITEFGRAIYQYNALTKATRDATRYLSTQGAGDETEINAAKCLVMYGNKTCSGTVLVPNLTPAMISVCDSSETALVSSCPTTHRNQPTVSGVINLVTITVTGYRFTTLVPFFSPSITFNNISTTMRQVL